MLLGIILGACAPELGQIVAGDDPAPQDEDTVRDPVEVVDPCRAATAVILPTDGAADVAPDGPFVAVFDDVVDTVEFTLTGPAGSIAGSVRIADDARSAVFEPNLQLTRADAYELVVQACDTVEVSSSFVVVGPTVTADDIVGHTYVFDLARAEFTEPQMAPLLLAELVTDQVAVRVDAFDEEAQILTARGAALYDDGGLRQFECSDLLAFEQVDFADNPLFSAGPAQTSLFVNGVDVPVLEVVVEGEFDPDGDSLNNVRVTGLVDVNGIDMGLDYTICELAELGGDACVICPSHGGETCIWIDAAQSAAPRTDVIWLSDDYDPADNPDCW